MLETLETYAELIKEGKVRAIGASNFTAARLRHALETANAHGLPRYECLQPRFNLYDRADFEGELEQLCLKENIGVIPYHGLASGFLTGKYRSPADFGKSQRGGRMSDYLNPRGRRILAALDEVAAAHQVNPAAVALAWLIARPSITAPIASATSVDQLSDFAAAAELRLSPGEINEAGRCRRVIGRRGKKAPHVFADASYGRASWVPAGAALNYTAGGDAAYHISRSCDREEIE
jgi:aryl-alcohol dehydrogenase-like predicted oxidoreductase